MPTISDEGSFTGGSDTSMDLEKSLKVNKLVDILNPEAGSKVKTDKRSPRSLSVKMQAQAEAALKRRRRKRYQEVNRFFECDYPNCGKSYGSLTHLNEHRVIQKHGERKRLEEFKHVKDLIAFKKLEQSILKRETVILSAPEDSSTGKPQFLMPKWLEHKGTVEYVPIEEVVPRPAEEHDQQGSIYPPIQARSSSTSESIGPTLVPPVNLPPFPYHSRPFTEGTVPSAGLVPIPPHPGQQHQQHLHPQYVPHPPFQLPPNYLGPQPVAYYIPLVQASPPPAGTQPLASYGVAPHPQSLQSLPLQSPPDRQTHPLWNQQAPQLYYDYERQCYFYYPNHGQP